MYHTRNTTKTSLTTGASRVGLPSGPSSRKSSVLDLSQQQQQQLQQLQQLQLQQQQYLQQQLPIGVGNADTSPPSEDEDKRYRPRWKGSGSQLPPQSPKQALSRLKQAASASNVAQDTQRQGQLLATNPLQQRKSSMFQLDESQASPPPTTTTHLQRKGSMYVAKVTETPPLGTPTRKGSVYQRGGVGLGVHSPGADSPQRKQSVVKTLSGSYVNTCPLTASESSYGLKLGPSQIHPKGYRLTTARYGELKMGFLKIKGNVEVELICARNIVNEDCETPPDTYVKCYIKDGDRLRHKKKTRVVRHAAEPLYRQTIKYQSSDVFGRNIVIMVWQRCVGFEHNQGLGGTEVNLDKLSIGQPINGWYPLFPMHSYGGSDSDNSP